MDLAPAARASASDDVHDQLQQSILAGAIEAGQPMPSERSLAQALQVSRPVVREALQRLAQAGLIRIRHGGATTVTDFRRIAGPDLLSALLLDRTGDLDLEVARGVVEARSQFGPPVAATAAHRAEAADLAAVDDAVATLRRATDAAGRQAAALEVWDAIVDASHNVVHRLLFNALRRAYEPVMDALAAVMADEVSDVDAYARVAAAIRAGDADAAEAAVHAIVDRGAQAAIAAIDDLLALPPHPDEEAAR